MTIAGERQGQAKATDHRIGIRRHFTTPEVHPYDEIEWEKRDARISDYRTGEVAFEQLDVEVPSFWSVNATNILAQKYFRGILGTPERERSLRQVADRVADTITDAGIDGGYFADDEEAETFRSELKYLIVNQRAAFNSPVWFNIGVPDTVRQSSACFILHVEDSMDSILNWYAEEGRIFKGGSGAGVNLSNLRGSVEHLNGGGTASGPVSFMRGADASAGTIKSGGKTRRAAKMVMLDADHPDVREFIWCKAREERKARALEAAGFDMGVDGDDSFSVQYQNANNSVRVSDEFMQAVIDDEEWHLIARTTREVVATIRAKDLFREIAQAAWECADPGLQFDTTMNAWHTASNTGRINGSNPCSEYLHLDNSACNLSSINLLKYLDSDGAFDVEAFKHTVEVMITAQEILVGYSEYPTPSIAENTLAFRQLGLGYANIGALLMALGMPYDSDDGRSWSAAITALMTGHAYETSGRIAARVGAFSGYAANAEPMKAVLEKHESHAVALKADTEFPADAMPILLAACDSWAHANDLCAEFGVRNAQASVLAPTGTISFLMDCDTTGVEPDLGLVKTKKLVGGGTMSIVNQTIPRGLARLGYSESQIAEVVAYIDEHKSILGAPHVTAEHLPVFACSMGDNAIHYLGHVKMLGAVQPFISGGISKTVNMPEDVTVEDVEQLHIDAWRMGLKAVAIYRDNCKVGQPLSVAKKDDASTSPDGPPLISDEEARQRIAELEAALHASQNAPRRVRLPRRRHSRTTSFTVADVEGYTTVGEYEDGRPGELFIKVAKQGSTLSGVMDAFAISVSLGLQHGVPLSAFVAKYTNMRFEPAGFTDDPELRGMAASIVDYIFRRLALDYLSPDERLGLGIFSTAERIEMVNGDDHAPSQTLAVAPEPVLAGATAAAGAGGPKRLPVASDAPCCPACGGLMVRAGACFCCPEDGTTSGCS